MDHLFIIVSNMLLKMINTIQDYAWGSEKYLQELTGTKHDGPLAELWMGVHPRGESLVETPDGTILPLVSFLENDPENLLGEGVERRFGSLPFLFKLLAAGNPLSIQVHPAKNLAEEGFDRENAKRIPLDGFKRNYKDRNHKPEIICAMTPFWALKGLRDPDIIIEKFIPWFPKEKMADFFPGHLTEKSERLRCFVTALLTAGKPVKEQILSAAIKWAQQQTSSEASWVLNLSEKHPLDMGILSPLYLNLVYLEPGEALYLPAGKMHAYLKGFGVELMANSDNVIRGGLTSKHVDVSELLNVLTFQTNPQEILHPRLLPDGTEIYDTPAEEFQLIKLTLTEDFSAVHLDDDYPVAVLVVTEGDMTIKEKDSVLVLHRGESCFLTGNSGSRNISCIGNSASGFIARAVPA